MVAGVAVFAASGVWGLVLWARSSPTLLSLLELKEVGNALDGMRLIGQNSLSTNSSGNHILTLVVLGVFGLLLCLKQGPWNGFFRWCWTIGWHEELWVAGLTAVYLQYLNWAWVTPFIFEAQVLLIVAAAFWGHLQKRDYAFVGVSAIFFIFWAVFGHMDISSCLGTASFVSACGNTVTASLWEVGSWFWIIGVGVVTWCLPKKPSLSK